eukprot:10413738-Lingulodinium_polyedra.AAC.1
MGRPVHAASKGLGAWRRVGARPARGNGVPFPSVGRGRSGFGRLGQRCRPAAVLFTLRVCSVPRGLSAILTLVA